MRKLILINFLMVIALCVNAQIDITKYYLENYGFDDKFDYKSGQTTNVAEEIKSVKGWTSTLSATLWALMNLDLRESSIQLLYPKRAMTEKQVEAWPFRQDGTRRSNFHRVSISQQEPTP